jgi:formylglycine-generating enzyme
VRPRTADGVSNDYFLYPTQNNTAPSNQKSDPPGNNEANFFNGNSPLTPAGVTDVGYFEDTTTFYGNFDMGGNLWEWNDAIINDADRGVRGGAWDTTDESLESTNRGQLNPVNSVYNDSDVGFRLASSIPEPGAIFLVSAGVGILLLFGGRGRDGSGSKFLAEPRS